MSELEASAPPPPLPLPHRRPRVREVSSRFMTPSASHSHSSSSSSPLPNQRQRSSSVQRPSSSASASPASSYPDENRNVSNRSSPQRRPNPPRAVAKLVFKESSNRSDTPTVLAPAAFRPRRSAASKLLHSSESDSNSNDDTNTIATRTTPTRTTPGLVVSSRYLGSLNNGGGLDSPCSRSLDLQRSSSDSSALFNSLKVSERERERRTNPMKLSGSGLPLPPPLSQTKVTASSCSFEGAKKAKKVSGHQEDVHSLKMLYNRYLQWRFVNAKAETLALSQRRGAERALYAHGMKIAELYESVAKMRIQLLQLQKLKTFLNILDTQMPYLDQWSTLEEDYATSLSEAIQALLNASVQIPTSRNVRADVREMQDALNSAMKFMESIAFNISNFMLKAEQNEVLLLELARLAGGEKSLIEECGYLLTGVHKFQVEECSLRSQLVQLHRTK